MKASGHTINPSCSFSTNESPPPKTSHLCSDWQSGGYHSYSEVSEKSEKQISEVRALRVTSVHDWNFSCQREIHERKSRHLYDFVSVLFKGSQCLLPMVLSCWDTRQWPLKPAYHFLTWTTKLNRKGHAPHIHPDNEPLLQGLLVQQKHMSLS